LAGDAPQNSSKDWPLPVLSQSAPSCSPNQTPLLEEELPGAVLLFCRVEVLPLEEALLALFTA